ncbi:pyrroline-5-carboxylate reductase [Eubacteriales bacterium OttesenSCG-928-N13]|nr:pyrroline-5-carboxylate reductase [Eubacteriales bacterium OttesenSCG-928-N13]
MTLGFVGAGNMAGAIIKGAVGAGILKGEQIHVYDLDTAKLDQLASELGVIKHDSCDALVAGSDMIVMAVKPQILGGVLTEQKMGLAGKAVISIAAGWSVQMLKDALPSDARVLRVMPNTPTLVCAGMSALSKDTSLSADESKAAEALFGALGRVTWVMESQMEAVTGVSGSGPAYAYMFMEAMADGGVLMGLPRQQATEMAAQTLLGAAQMVLETGKHPGELKDMVCSPGGTTIAAVHALEKAGVRGGVIDAVIASARKAQEMKA